METKTWEEAKAEASALFAGLRIEATAANVRAAIDGDWPNVSTDWTFKAANGKSLQATWRQGIACLDWKKADHLGNRAPLGFYQMAKGKRLLHAKDTLAVVDFMVSAKCLRNLSEPFDVFATLCRDAVDARDASFEEWAGNFGADTDSRKAEAVWRKGNEDWHALTAMVGEASVRTLADLAAQF